MTKNDKAERTMRIPRIEPTRRKFATLAVLALLIGVLFVLSARPVHAATTFTVNSTGDQPDADLANSACDADAAAAGNQCTLRATIQQANATTGADTINFHIPTNDPGRDPNTGVFTIKPSSQLTVITDPVTIDGYTQPGAKKNTLAKGDNAVLKVELDGSGAGFANGLTISAGSSTVRGLVINRFFNAIDLRTGSNNTVEGNFLGTDPTGSTDQGNGTGVDVELGSNTNTIGGSTPGARNLLSGNVYGFQFSNATSGNKVQGNFIGTKKNGTEPLSNSADGVGVAGNNHVIGGTTSGERNVISGNGRDGVRIAGSGNKVQGNYIGADATGTADLGNGRHGVFVDDTIFISNNTIGGTTAGARNVISGNGQNGVSIVGVRATNTFVQGNYIGTDKTGAADLGNDRDGVEVDDSDNNTIGGPVTGEGNVVSSNDFEGIVVRAADGNTIQGNRIGTDKDGTKDLGNYAGGVTLENSDNTAVGQTTSGVGKGNTIAFTKVGNGVLVYFGSESDSILSNSIFSNGGLGIDLDSDGVTPNDTGDPDTGANNLQNYPVLTSAKVSRKKGTTVTGTLNSTASTTFTLQFFSTPSGNGEGKKYLGQKSVTTDSGGNVSFTFKTRKKASGEVTATTTNDATGDTSEFSAAVGT